MSTNFSLSYEFDFSVPYTEEGKAFVFEKISKKEVLDFINEAIKQSGLKRWMKNFYGEKYITDKYDGKIVLDIFEFQPYYFDISYYHVFLRQLIGNSMVINPEEINKLTAAYFSFVKIISSRYIQNGIEKELNEMQRVVRKRIKILEETARLFNREGYETTILLMDTFVCLYLKQEGLIISLIDDSNYEPFQSATDLERSMNRRCMNVHYLNDFNSNPELIHSMIKSFQLSKVYEEVYSEGNSSFDVYKNNDWINFSSDFDKTLAIETLDRAYLDMGNNNGNAVICMYGYLKHKINQDDKVVVEFYRTIEELYNNFELNY